MVQCLREVTDYEARGASEYQVPGFIPRGAMYRQNRRQGIPLGMDMPRRVGISRVAKKISKIVVNAIPILLGISFYQSYWQDQGGSPKSFGDQVLSIVGSIAVGYLTFALIVGMFLILWGIIKLIIRGS